MFNSIKIKLIVWFLVIFSIVLLGLEIFMYYKLESVVISLVDDHLKSTTNSLANLLTVEDEHGQLDMGLAEVSQATTGDYAEKLSGNYYQIYTSGGVMLVRSPSLTLANTALPMSEETLVPRYDTVTGPAGEPTRIVTQTFKFPRGNLTFQAGESMKETNQLMSSFRNFALVMFPAVFLICAVGVFFITDLAMKSLKVFSVKINQITEESLSERVETDSVAAELKPLAASFNGMLSKLEGSFLRQRQFLSDASHELRTPTTIIKSFCDVTLGRDRAGEEYKEAIKKIGETVNRMCDIINRILVVSRFDSKTVELKPVRVDIKDVMKDVLRLMESAANNKGVQIDLQGPNLSIRGDREGLTEVFTNIIENAVKYNRQNGNVDITIGEDAGTAVISVADTGIGIPDDELEKIFDRFYRVDASRGQTVGSGLGLSIVRTIVEAHGGRIEVKSEQGKGSLFQVFLPKMV
ncbi:MAG: sensor histidine kinase N-terminal domain-containing protein [Deltaproteobacteria bacterium]|nr:sensor histidine kinase N-terminal domain-containing protein [Deltaproteobacteria bacterium]